MPNGSAVMGEYLKRGQYFIMREKVGYNYLKKERKAARGRRRKKWDRKRDREQSGVAEEREFMIEEEKERGTKG